MIMHFKIFFSIVLLQIRQKASEVTHLEKQLDEKMSVYGSHAAKLKDLQEELQSKHRRIGELEGILEVKNTELKETKAMMEKVKGLHVEQCKEMELQIEEVSEKTESYCAGGLGSIPGRTNIQGNEIVEEKVLLLL